MSTLDNAKNFAKATVSIGYNAADVSIVLQTGGGARMPTAPFNVTWWNSTDYPDPSDDPSVEIVRCTNVTGDTLTVTRAQEGTAATVKNISGKVYKMIAPLTAKVINTDIPALVGGTPVYGEAPANSGDNTNFTLAHTPIANSVRLYRGGARQAPSADYTVVTNTITLVIPIQGGEVLLADYGF